MDPIYEYRKGEGWVALPNTGKWCIVFKDQYTKNWNNVSRAGFYYTSWAEAQAKYLEDLEYFKGNIQHHGWKFKIIPYTPGCDDGGWERV